MVQSTIETSVFETLCCLFFRINHIFRLNKTPKQVSSLDKEQIKMKNTILQCEFFIRNVNLN